MTRTPVAGRERVTRAQVARTLTDRLPAAPVAPSAPTATVLSATSLLLRWRDRSARETRFRLERQVGAGAFAFLANLTPNTEEYLDTGLTEGVAYQYRLRAENGTGNSAWTTTATATPAALDGINATFTAPEGDDLLDYTPEAGGTASVPIGAFEIQSNRLVSTDVDYSLGFAYWETSADHTGSCVVRFEGLTTGIVVRGTDPANHWFLRLSTNAFGLYQRRDGTDVLVASTAPTVTAGQDYTVAWTCRGAEITATLNGGSQVQTLTATFNQAARQVGLRTSFATSAWDTLLVTPAVAAQPAITVHSPAALQLFQLDTANQAEIPVTGYYTGTPDAIQGRWQLGPWIDIDRRPLNNRFSGSLPAQARGQGTLEVRFANQREVLSARANVGIGYTFLIIGQSNAVGEIFTAQSYSHASLIPVVYRQDLTWRAANDPIHVFNGPTNGSVWPTLATLLMAELGAPIAFLSTAVGGTGLVSPADWSRGGDEYNNCLRQVRESDVPRIDFILMHQGENDALGGVGQAAYAAALSQMLTDMRADAPALANAVLIPAQIGQYNSLGAEARAKLDPVRLAQQERWDNDARIFAGPLTYDYDLVANGGDGLHIKDTALGVTHAERWARMVLYQILGAGDGRGPRFSHASKAGDQLAVTFTGGAGSLQNGTDTTGWLVTDGVGTRTVTEASAVGSVVTLTVDQPLTGTALVSFGSGNDGAGATLRDSGTYPLPPEPFVAEEAV